jgi:hypothetical protein
VRLVATIRTQHERLLAEGEAPVTFVLVVEPRGSMTRGVDRWSRRRHAHVEVLAG